MNDIEDVVNPDEFLDILRENQKIIRAGFMALAIDYGYYVKSTFLNESKTRIYELRDDLMYRVNSSEVLFLILLKHREEIGNRFSKMLKDNPKVFEGFLSGNPHFERATDEIMAIYDSIIFHLSSAFDYLGMMTNYVFGGNDNSLKWNGLVKSCRDSGNKYSNFEFSKEVLAIHKSFVDKFNHYRADLIHRKSSQAFSSVLWNPNVKRVQVLFECSDKLKKSFKNILHQEHKYSISFLCFRLINECTYKIAEVLNGMKREFEVNGKPHSDMFSGKFPSIISFDPKTGVKSPSEHYWNEFDKLLRSKDN